MITVILLSTVAAALAGLLIKLALDYSGSEKSITLKEYAVCLLIIAAAIAPFTAKIGWSVAKGNLIRFSEYRNGWETAAAVSEIPCEKDGSCQHTYRCEPYTVWETYTTIDSDGDLVTQCCRPETYYHRCPFVKKEYTYTVSTTLSNHTIAANRFPKDPEEFRWKGTKDYQKIIPPSVLAGAGMGAPKFWSEVKDRIAAGRPGPATSRAEYDNYVLASERENLKRAMREIAAYRDAKLLPSIENRVIGLYESSKAQFVGYTPTDYAQWQESLARLNGALGSELQGDLRLVVVRSDIASRNPADYAAALKSYWQNPEVFGKEALSKNGIVVVVGTEDGNTVSWARAFTGMPVGNEEMLRAVQDRLEGVLIAPEVVLGETVREISPVGPGEPGNAPGPVVGKTLHGNGALERILWGLDDPATRFTRVKMGKYLYRMNEIQPTASQKFWIGFMAFIASLILWWIAAAVGDTVRRRYDY